MAKDVDPKVAAKAFSKLGASKGGIARREKLTAEERSEIARKAVEARWAKKKALETKEGADAVRVATIIDSHLSKIIDTGFVVGGSFRSPAEGERNDPPPTVNGASAIREVCARPGPLAPAIPTPCRVARC
jgi:hypothetical protein